MIKIYIGISILCAVIWLLLSGIYTPFLLSLGVLSCGLVVWLAQRMGLLDDDVPNIGLLLRFFAYLPWLIGEIAKANIDVIKRTLSPQLPISPTLFRVRCTQRSDLGRVIFANSITLTPGTVAIMVEDDYIEVHALSQETADDLTKGVMDQRVSRVEGPGVQV